MNVLLGRRIIFNYEHLKNDLLFLNLFDGDFFFRATFIPPGFQRIPSCTCQPEVCGNGSGWLKWIGMWVMDLGD